MRGKTRSFVERVSRRINLDNLIAEGEVYDYATMKLALSKVLRRGRQPTDKQVQLFLDYYDLIGKEYYVPARIKPRIEDVKLTIQQGYKFTEVTRKGKKYVVLRDKKGRFVRWYRAGS